MAACPKLDGILASLDIQGLGVQRALKKNRLKIKDDVKLVSLTGISIGAYLETTMTSMEVQAAEIGEEAVGMLIHDIEKKDAGKAIKKLVVKSVLVEREST